MGANAEGQHGGVSTTWVVLALAGLVGSATALALAPLLMPDDYSWVANTTSESAAQGIDGAWLARLGLLLFGLSALLVAAMRAPVWPRPAVWLESGFGALLVAAAAFSTRSWRPGTSFDRVEDAVHSVAATTVGFAFAFGAVAILGLQPRAREPGRRAMGIAAVIAAVALPGGMSVWPGIQGVLQRAMFLVAYLWFATEVLYASRRRPLQ